METRRTIALLAGTGLASKLGRFLKDAETFENFDVSFGNRRGKVLYYYRSSYEALDIIVIPRHGPTLSVPDRSPAELVRLFGHEAHIWHLHELGASAIYSFNSVGALDRSVQLAAKNGFLIPNGYARGIGMIAHSFGEKALTIHPSMADPFDDAMQRKLMQAVSVSGAYAIGEGTYINSLGDAFESAVEAQAYRSLYSDAPNRVLGMTYGC